MENIIVNEEDILGPHNIDNGRDTTNFLNKLLDENPPKENIQPQSSTDPENIDSVIVEKKPTSPESVSQPPEEVIPIGPIEDPIPVEKPKEEDRNKKIKKVIEEDNLDKIISYFKKIKNPDIPKEGNNGYEKDYGWFHCGKKNEANGNICELGKEMCPNCMKKTQELYKLKPHYLINSNGRICTYKKNKIYCLCKMTRVESETKSKDNKEIGIKYSISYTCGHTGQCDPCKNLTSIMDKYFGANLMKKLKKRDETELN